MKLRKLLITDIIVPEVRVTARMDEDTAQAFHDSVAAIGVDEPVKVYQVEDKFYLSDGLHRILEAKRAGATTIDAIVKVGTYEDVICNNLQSGHLRGKHPVSEMIKSIAYLWKEKGYDSIAIHKKTGLTQDYIEKLQKLSTLTPLILAGLDEGRPNVGQAFQLLRFTDPVQQESVYHTIRQYGFKGRELEAWIDDVIKISAAPNETVQQPQLLVPVLVHCEYCGAEGRPGEIANPNTCAACSLAMRQSIAMARVELEREEAARKKNEPPTG